ncbi:hypothetical protein PVAG01_05909 [Phlyctema vagabunda]|uniref:Aminotransferase class I/classII large domain-containing protein n=1 Tax=Phlyctema vagabunda TaxID=108571 RepID=A0ABR4PEK8_9HELO
MGSVQAVVDLSHHLNELSKARHESPLKAIIKYMAYDGMLSLAGGLPHPSLFPFQSISLDTYPAGVELDAANPDQVPPGLEVLSISKAAQGKDSLDLTTALQYGGGMGDKTLIKWAHDFTSLVFQPASEDFQILMNAGNTDAWAKVVGLLCEPGDVVITEEYSYPSSQSKWIPLGCKAAPIKMDENGMRADHLEQTLAEWETVHPEQKRPHLLYIVPVGSNPAGTTMGAERRKAIYDICVKYDIIICEDDPYCFLQYPTYDYSVPSSPPGKVSSEKFLSSLVPSFLKFDYQGRVIRLDTFSKTLAPGNRLGYFVANPLFCEKLLQATQVDTQAPSGWSQAIVMGLLNKWGTPGYIQWLGNLRDQYQTRRDWMCDSIATKFAIKPASSGSIPGAEGLVAFSKISGKPLFSFVPPTGGMFIWCKIYFAGNAKFETLKADPSCSDPEEVCSDGLWIDLCNAKVLVTPGSYYVPWQGREKATTKTRGGEESIGHFRLAFSMTTKEEMDEALQRIANVFEDFWQGQPI